MLFGRPCEKFEYLEILISSKRDAFFITTMSNKGVFLLKCRALQI